MPPKHKTINAGFPPKAIMIPRGNANDTKRTSLCLSSVSCFALYFEYGLVGAVVLPEFTWRASCPRFCCLIDNVLLGYDIVRSMRDFFLANLSAVRQSKQTFAINQITNTEVKDICNCIALQMCWSREVPKHSRRSIYLSRWYEIQSTVGSKIWIYGWKRL